LFHRFHRPAAVGLWFFFPAFFLMSPGTSPSSASASIFFNGTPALECRHLTGADCDRKHSDPQFHNWLFQLDGWGELPPADSAFAPEDADRLDDPDPDHYEWVAALKSAQPYQRTRLTLGRQRVLGGVTDHRVDGLKLSAGLGAWFSATAFGGLPSPSHRNKNNAGDLIYGARIATHPMSLYEIGLSYQKLINNSQDVGENAGADLRLKIGSHLTVSGLSNYNVEGRGWREHSYSAVLNVHRFQIKPSYRYFQLDDHFDKHGAESRIFGFLRKNEEVVNIAGTDLLWRGFGPLQFGLRGRSYDYKRHDERAFYYAGLLNYQTPGASRIDLEVGRMEGETPENRYSLLRCNLYWKNPLRLKNSFFSADALYMDYDEPIWNRGDALHAALNGGLLFPRRNFEIKLSGIYSRDPYFHDDIGALVSFILRY
jgi:hypothetical protein